MRRSWSCGYIEVAQASKQAITGRSQHSVGSLGLAAVRISFALLVGRTGTAFDRKRLRTLAQFLRGSAGRKRPSLISGQARDQILGNGAAFSTSYSG